jgi:hypothetical protein
MKIRTMLLLAVFVVTFALWMFAASAQDKDDQARNGKTATVTGCLAKGDEPNEFYLTADNGKRYEVRSDKVSLADHVGHKITLTGTAAKESGEEEEREESRHNEAAEHNAVNLQVSNVQMVSSSCK